MSSNIFLKSPLVVAKSGAWYTICNFLFKTMAFLTTPFFARLMSKTELGGFTDFASMSSILMVITSLDLAQAIIRSKSDHGDDMDSFIWSILAFSTIWTLILYALFLAFPSFFMVFFNMDVRYVHVLFWYLLAAPPYTMLITKQRAYYKYKQFVILTGIMTVSGTAMAFILVLLMQNKLTGRIIGFYSPFILFGIVVFFYLAVKGKKIKVQYWKYATLICVPIVPHSLALHVLGVSDILLITRFCGPEYTAFYSIAYSAYHISTVFFDSLNKAWSPWLMDCLNLKRYEEIRKASKYYILVFISIIVGLLLFVPEIVFVLGGEQYERSIYCLPALLTSCCFLFIFTMYVNVEFFEKKTFGVSIATMIGTAINVFLNVIILPMNPENSFIIASYTTLAGYIVLFVLHYFIVRRMKMNHVFDTRYILCVLGGVMIFAGVMNIVYGHAFIRVVLIIIYAGVLTCGIYKNKDRIRKIFQ